MNVRDCHETVCVCLCNVCRTYDFFDFVFVILIHPKYIVVCDDTSKMQTICSHYDDRITHILNLLPKKKKECVFSDNI